MPLFLLSLLPAWLKVRGEKWFPASAVPHLQINSVSPVKHARWGKPKPSNLHGAFNMEGKIYIKAQEMTDPISVHGKKT